MLQQVADREAVLLGCDDLQYGRLRDVIALE
jgi:hypothetical protein